MTKQELADRIRAEVNNEITAQNTDLEPDEEPEALLGPATDLFQAIQALQEQGLDVEMGFKIIISCACEEDWTEADTKKLTQIGIDIWDT